MDCGIFYIIAKLLERRCLKCARIAQLDMQNTSYDQSEKVRNRPDLLVCKQRATYR
jgi:hypothetical protein